MKYPMLAGILLSLMTPLMAHAELRVFACEPEWQSLAEEIGRNLVDATSATTARQDPHYIEARPSLISRVRQADLVLCSGAELEVGWLPALMNKANNPQVQPGSSGYIETSSLVNRLDIPSSVDRSQGDVHPQGNPHVQTNPHNIAVIAEAVGQRMMELDSANAATYRANLDDFLTRWNAAISGWEAAGKALQGKRVIPHHKSWTYMEQWLGLEEVGTLEAVPGIPPTPSHLSDLVNNFSDGRADFILRTPYQSPKSADWLASRTGIRSLELPFTVGGTDKADDLFGLFDDTLDRLLGVTQ